MKEIDPSMLEAEQLKKLYKTFFYVIQCSLEIKDKNKTRFSKIIGQFPKLKSVVSFQTLLENKNNIQFAHFDYFIKKIRSLEKNPAYLETIEWKILEWLSYDLKLVSTKNPTPIIEAIEYLDKVEFLQEDSFSALSMASVIYCLSHPEPVSAAKMLVRLNALNLLTEQNIGKIDAMPQSTFGFLPKIVHKLNLVEEDGTSHLLNQANLDKLL